MHITELQNTVFAFKIVRTCLMTTYVAAARNSFQYFSSSGTHELLLVNSQFNFGIVNIWKNDGGKRQNVSDGGLTGISISVMFSTKIIQCKQWSSLCWLLCGRAVPADNSVYPVSILCHPRLSLVTHDDDDVRSLKYQNRHRKRIYPQFPLIIKTVGEVWVGAVWKWTM